jgi:hypothetical protein
MQPMMRTMIVTASMLACSGIFPGRLSANEPPAVTGSVVWNQLRQSGATYSLPARSVPSDNPKYGLFTTWVYSPQMDIPFKMRARYCLSDLSLDAALHPILQSVELMQGSRVLATMDKPLKTVPTYEQVLQPNEYYSDNPDYAPYDDYVGVSRGFAPSLPPENQEPMTCAAGLSSFDLGPAVNDLSNLPEQPLKVRLTFGDGEYSFWEMEAETVSALKKLLQMGRR